MKILFYILVFTEIGIAQNVANHRWQERVVTIHTDSTQKELANTQLNRFLTLKNEMIDRNLVLYYCEDANCTYYNFFDPPSISTIGPAEISFETRLYGLDGQLKYESNQLISPQAFFAIIDKMPMRRNEMRKRIKKSGYE